MMLAYAAHTRPLGRSESPKALVFIVAGHALLLGALFLSRTEVIPRTGDPIEVTLLPNPPKPPPPEPIEDPRTPTEPAVSTIDQPRVIVPPVVPQPGLHPGPAVIDVTPYVGPAVEPPVTRVIPKTDPLKVGPRFNTPDRLLRPPYPLSRLRAEQEASLRLRLSIDRQGRVIAVDPVGTADPEFLAAARRHILRSWRYQPATEDGAAVTSSVVITLQFRLDQA